MRACAFVGPSLGVNERPRYAGLEYRPMARRGDVTAAVREGFDAIVLIDGAMIYEYPPSPREIALALTRGVRLVGAASIGALRAVELAPLGMEGVGWVYEQFRSGAVDCDDELVCLYAEALGQRLSIPLINIRYACRTLITRRELARAPAARLIAALRTRYYEERDEVLLDQLVQEAGLAICPKALLAPEFDIKAIDALLALHMVATSAPLSGPRGSIS